MQSFKSTTYGIAGKYNVDKVNMPYVKYKIRVSPSQDVYFIVIVNIDVLQELINILGKHNIFDEDMFETDILTEEAQNEESRAEELQKVLIARNFLKEGDTFEIIDERIGKGDLYVLSQNDHVIAYIPEKDANDPTMFEGSLTGGARRRISKKRTRKHRRR